MSAVDAVAEAIYNRKLRKILNVPWQELDTAHAARSLCQKEAQAAIAAYEAHLAAQGKVIVDREVIEAAIEWIEWQEQQSSTYWLCLDALRAALAPPVEEPE